MVVNVLLDNELVNCFPARPKDGGDRRADVAVIAFDVRPRANVPLTQACEVRASVAMVVAGLQMVPNVRSIAATFWQCHE